MQIALSNPKVKIGKGTGVCSNKYGSYDRNEIALMAIGIKKNSGK